MTWVRGVASAALVLTALMLIPAGASAAVIGTLDLANCSGGGVTVTQTTINWEPVVSLNDGCVQTGSGTSVTYSGGSLTGGQSGSILDLDTTNPLPIADFIVFATAPTLHFDLTVLGPGPSNTACTNSFNVNAPACAAFAGSPFLLQSTATGTSVTLSLTGVARDSSGSSTWIGAFTTQIAGVTPGQIQTTILGGGSVTSTYSGDFTVTAVPEPGTLGSMVLGGLLIAVGSIRRRARR